MKLRNYITLLTLLSALSAEAQNVLTIGNKVTDVSGVSGNSYDRIEMTRNIPEGKFTAFAVAAPLDGYVFGSDAARFMVTKMTATGDGDYDIEVSPMPDADDFQPGTLYLVRPEAGLGIGDGYTEKSVISYTAGIQTKVQSTSQPLVCTADVKARYAIGSITQIINDLNGKGGITPSAADGAAGLRSIDALLNLMGMGK